MTQELAVATGAVEALQKQLAESGHDAEAVRELETAVETAAEEADRCRAAADALAGQLGGESVIHPLQWFRSVIMAGELQSSALVLPMPDGSPAMLVLLTLHSSLVCDLLCSFLQESTFSSATLGRASSEPRCMAPSASSSTASSSWTARTPPPPLKL